MAIAVTLATAKNARKNHRITTAAIGAVTTWQAITFPSGNWKRVEIINFGADSMFVSTEVDDGDTGTGGVEIPAGGSYSFQCGGPDGAFAAVRHAAGSYTFGLALNSDPDA